MLLVIKFYECIKVVARFMKTANRIMGIISLAMGALCIIPSIIGILAGISLMTEDEVVSRVVATILFEVFLFVGGAITTMLSSKPFATIMSSGFLVIAGVLQIAYNAEFSLRFIGVMSLLILSWVAVISIVFGVLIFVFSIITIKKKTNGSDKTTNDEPYPQRDSSKDMSDEIRKYKSLLDDELITQEEFEAKKKQILNL